MPTCAEDAGGQEQKQQTEQILPVCRHASETDHNALSAGEEPHVSTYCRCNPQSCDTGSQCASDPTLNMFRRDLWMFVVLEVPVHICAIAKLMMTCHATCQASWRKGSMWTRCSGT
jgi:hypothetical protein